MPAEGGSAKRAAVSPSLTSTREPNSFVRSAAGVSSATRRVRRYGDAIRHALYFVQIVRRNQDRPPFAAQTQDQVANIARALRVEPGRRLVEQHDLRLVQQRARQRDPLLQSLRELRGAIVSADR